MGISVSRGFQIALRTSTTARWTICPPVRRCRAGVAARPVLGCRHVATAVPGRTPGGCGPRGRVGGPPAPPRRRPTSPHPPNDEAARSRSCARTPCGSTAFPSAPALRSTRSLPGRPGSFVGFIATIPSAGRRSATPPVGDEISRFPDRERPCMLGSPTTPDRDAPRDNAAPRVAFRVRNPVGVRNFLLSRLDARLGGDATH
jgi:hypothetical protein